MSMYEARRDYRLPPGTIFTGDWPATQGMTAEGASRDLGLVAWGGSALRRWLWWRERRRAARQAVRHAVQTVLGR